MTQIEQKETDPILVEKLSQDELLKRGVFLWEIWEKEVSTFDYHYDTEEQCYFLEGQVLVTTKDCEYTIEKGDFVIFPKGLSCVWHIKSRVKKHYRFE